MSATRDLMQQVDSLLHKYPGLKIKSQSSTEIVLEGAIELNRKAKGYTLSGEYFIEVVIPLSAEELPYVLDKGNHIETCYPHRYIDGRLCLETDASIMLRFRDGFSLEAWMEEFVEPYFFSYEYYKRYGAFPFGERSHGLSGLVETYSDLWGEPDLKKTLLLMKAVSERDYRGHLPCPCGSGKKMRACHGPLLISFYEDQKLKRVVQRDFKYIGEEVRKYNEQRRNSE